MGSSAALTAWLILVSFAWRLGFADAMGLGIDESYMVAAGRHLQLSYFDHPPLAWWMAWGAAHLLGSDAALVVRLPFILVFALSTILMYRLASRLFGPAAGFWAAAMLNVIPVLGMSAGTWVLPDGPLLAALLGTALCLFAALPARGAKAWGWWLATGASAGLALSSKYTAAFTLFGAGIFMFTEPAARAWCRRPHPYAAVAVALLVFSPVLIWNAQHGWASFVFQGNRAGGRFHLFGPILTWAGEALFIMPWTWLAAVICLLMALRQGPADPHRWFLACMSAPPIVIYAALSFRSHVLFHWSSPGYMMLAPLVGERIAHGHRRAGRIGLAASAAVLLIGTALVGSQSAYNWLPAAIGPVSLTYDPTLDLVDWTSLPPALERTGLLDRAGVVVAATRWSDAGKIDYVLEGRKTVICLGPDPREYGRIAPVSDYTNDDVLIVAPRLSLGQIKERFGEIFDAITELPAVTLMHHGAPAIRLALFFGRRLHMK